MPDVKEKVEGVSTGVHKLLHRQQDELQEAILSWLTPVNYATQHRDFMNRRYPGTGQWPLDSDEFQTWLGRDKQTLFCPGIPGAGKTVMTAIVGIHLQVRFEDDQSTGVAYIYCDFGRQTEQSAEDLLVSVLKQLSQKRSSLPMSVEALYNGHKYNQTKPSFDDISKTLQSVANMYSRVFIIIDALDECQATDGCRAKSLSEIFKLQASTGANIFATSRPIQEIKKSFAGSTALEIVAQEDNVEKYLDIRMSQLPLLHEENMDVAEETKEKLRKDIKSSIIGAANGVFLLARLHLESLTDQTTPNRVTEALKTLPKGEGALAHGYEETIKRIRSQKKGFRDIVIGDEGVKSGNHVWELLHMQKAGAVATWCHGQPAHR